MGAVVTITAYAQQRPVTLRMEVADCDDAEAESLCAKVELLMHEIVGSDAFTCHATTIEGESGV